MKLRELIFLGCAFSSLVLAGCNRVVPTAPSEPPTLQSSTPKTAIASDGYEAPWYEDESEVNPIPAKVVSITGYARFAGNLLKTSASTRFYGNRILIEATITGLPAPIVRSAWWVFAFEQNLFKDGDGAGEIGFTSEVQVPFPSTCGHVASNVVKVTARTVYVVGIAKTTELHEDIDTKPFSASQDDCPPPPEEGPGEGGEPCEGDVSNLSSFGSLTDASVTSSYCPGGGCSDWSMVEYGLFIWVDGLWWLVDSWWVEECSEWDSGGMMSVSSERPANDKSSRMPIRVVVVPDEKFAFGDAQTALVHRGAAPRTLVIRESAATAQVLSDALRGRDAWEKHEPNSAGSLRGTASRDAEATRITRSVAGGAYAWAADVISDLERAKPTHVPGVGTFRNVLIHR
jgi:hypothetical protein